MRMTLLFAAMSFGSSAFAVSVAINNASFEAQTLGGGSFFYSPTEITGWSSTATGAPDRGVWNTSAVGKDGANIAFVYRNNAIAQQLAETVGADRTYSFQYLLGRSGGPSTGTAELWAGGTVSNGVVTGGTLLATRTDAFSRSSMDETLLTYTSPTTGSVIGQLLTIRFVGTTINGQSYVSFDNARLDYEPVPEPASMLALGAGALIAARKRRK